MINNIDEKIQKAQKLLKSNNLGEKEYYSKFWKKLLKERVINFPPKNIIINMLSNNSTDGYGSFTNINNRKKFFINKVKTLSKQIPIDFLASLTDHGFGNPEIFEYKGIKSSIVFLQNMSFAYRITRLPLPINPSILEIGAGYGALAYQLHQKVNPKKYTIIDLPESLYLSYIFLGQTITDKPSVFSIEEKVNEGLEFLTPDQLEYLDSKYDLVINIASMQEMDLSMVEIYKSMIRDKLNDNGFFYCFNCHGKTDVNRPSNYLINDIYLYSIYHYITHAPNKIVNFLHYEIVQSKREGAFIDKNIEKFVNHQCGLIGLGLQYPMNNSAKYFEKGIRSFVLNDIRNAIQNLTNSLNSGLNGVAKAYALLIISLFDNNLLIDSVKDKYIKQILLEAPVFEEDILKYYSSIPKIHEIRHIMRNRFIRILSIIPKLDSCEYINSYKTKIITS